jgi:hypothetical protein
MAAHGPAEPLLHAICIMLQGQCAQWLLVVLDTAFSFMHQAASHGGKTTKTEAAQSISSRAFCHARYSE